MFFFHYIKQKSPLNHIAIEYIKETKIILYDLRGDAT
jgi:hypothetical protein